MAAHRGGSESRVGRLDSSELISIASSCRTSSSERPLEPNYIAVADLDSIAEGGVLKVAIEEHMLLLVRLTANTIQACQGLCPHDKADLALARLKDGRLVCSRHLASFDLASGAVSPGWDKVAPLRLYPARAEGGKIWVDIEAVRRNPPAGTRKTWDFAPR